MTEQEARILAKRLSRVWGISKPGLTLLNQGTFHFDGWIGDDMFLRVCVEDKHLLCTFSTVDGHYRLNFNPSDFLSQPDQDDYPIWKEGQQKFAAQWMAFFRRGLWLSGCPIEATTHEKAEWMQGFTKEELESWNLKV